MNQYIAIAVLLCLSAVNAQYIVSNSFAGTDCSGVALSAAAVPVGVCFSLFTGASAFVSYDSVGNFFNTSSYYSSTTCAGTPTLVNVQNITSCTSTSTGFRSYAYSATAPKLSGYASSTSTSCGGAPVGAITVSANINTCSPGFTSGSVKYAYYGGARCVRQEFDSADCSGTPSEQTPVPYYCDETTFTTYACQINGVYLGPNTLTPTYPSNGDTLVTKFYSTKTDCTGPVSITAYTKLASCDAGVKTTLNGNTVTSTTYDNYNCTGYTISTETSGSDETTLGQCEADRTDGSSTITTSGSFPASVNSPVITLQSTCGANPTVYSAYVTSAGCIAINSTNSGTLVCSTLSNGTISFVTNTYAGTTCQGAALETETELQVPCEVSPESEGLAIRYACSATFSTTSAASSVAVALSVMIMSLIALLM